MRSGWRPWCAACLTLLTILTGASGRAAEPTPLRPDYIDPSAFPDLSFLNHRPAGRFGRVRTEGETLVYGDGRPARFWGVNLQAYALFRTSADAIRDHARRLARLGVNLARIHHHDSAWVHPNIFGNRASDTLSLDAASVEKLDLWIAALKAEGIYLWLDLNVGRRFTAGDGITDRAEMLNDKGRADPRGFNYVNASLKDRMKAFQRAYLSHVNPLTGFAYKDDPAIVAVLISNENDLTHHFGNRLLPDKNVPVHNARYMALAQAFAEQHGLDPDRTWRSWTHGPAKLFLNDLEYRFHAEMIADLREIGFEGLIATTNFWGGMPMAGLPALSMGDIIDVHSYGAPEEIIRDPAHEADMFSNIAVAQLAGKPMSISEWNVSPFPVRDRFVIPLRISALSALQGWDAPMLYGYGQQSLDNPDRSTNWQAVNDPALLTMMPAGALIYRRGDVAEARKTYLLQPSGADLFDQPLKAGAAAAVRTLTEQSGLRIALPRVRELPWMREQEIPDGLEAVTDPDRSFRGEEVVIRSDTGEIVRDPGAGIFTIDTPRSQVAAGRLGGRDIVLSDMRLSLATVEAAVAVQSLDDLPIRSAHDLLISIATPSAPEAPRGLPFLTEPVTGTLRIWAAPGLVMDGTEGVRHQWQDGAHVLTFEAADGTQWLRLSRP